MYKGLRTQSPRVVAVTELGRQRANLASVATGRTVPQLPNATRVRKVVIRSQVHLNICVPCCADNYLTFLGEKSMQNSIVRIPSNVCTYLQILFYLLLQRVTNTFLGEESFTNAASVSYQ